MSERARAALERLADQAYRTAGDDAGRERVKSDFDTVAAGVVQTRAQVVASLAEDEALVERMRALADKWEATEARDPRAYAIFYAGQLRAALAAPADGGGTG